MNTKNPHYKEKLRIERELDGLYKIKWNQNWIPLEKPYKNGYRKYFDLRDDIKNRDDAWVFYACLELVGQTVWSKHKSFKSKYGKGKYEYISPGFGKISEDLYNRLVPAVKKYFAKIDHWDRDYNPYWPKYKCIANSWYFVEKIKAHWVTEYQEFDSIIEAQINEKNDYLRSEKFWPINSWYGGAPKDYCKPYNRSDRRHSKQTVKKNADKGGDCDSYEYRYAHKHSARWDYW